MAKKNPVLQPQTPEVTESKEVVPQTVVTKRVAVQNPNLIQIYANGFQISIGPLDVRMTLIETVPVGQSEIQDRQIAAVIMTPETLKLLADNIHRYVEQYEKQFGKIRDVPTTNVAFSLQENKG